MQALRVSPCFQENHEDLQLKLDMREETGSFFHRLLSREEATGYSSRIYYRAPALGRIPFNWEAEPGKPKTVESCYMKEELVDDEIIPPLSPPPSLQATNNGKSRSFSCGKGRAGLVQKIMYFLQQHKTLMKAKVRPMARSPTAEMTPSDAEELRDEMMMKNVGIGIKNSKSSESEREVHCAAAAETETDDDDGDLMSEFSQMSFGRSDTSSSSSDIHYDHVFVA